MSALNHETVLSVQHWTDRLFSFTTTRDPGFRFRSGQFTMVGMEVDGRPLLRAYSLASAHHEETLCFYSIKVPNGPLTSRLQHLAVGDTVLVGRKPTGTLITDNLVPGKRLYLLSTGTGIAPFLSLIKDPDAYELFEKIILVHGCRFTPELAYGEQVVQEVLTHEFLGEIAQGKLLYYPTITREPFRNQGRITLQLESGTLFRSLNLPPLTPEEDRIMLCGSPDMLSDLKKLIEDHGFQEGSNARPGQFTVEKAFAES